MLLIDVTTHKIDKIVVYLFIATQAPLRTMYNYPDKTIDTDNAEFQDAFALLQYTHQSVFLTGKAGTGKSTFLRYICEQTRKKYVVLAPTGIAAINAGGSTIHSFFKMPFRPLMPDDPDLSVQNNRIYDLLKYNKTQRKLLKEVELIIIDEISMVRADMIDFIDRVLRVFSGNMRTPFGGKQLLLVGDIYQLEPVVTADTREILARFYPTPFFFTARAFREISLVPIDLRKAYRQTDPTFIELLDKIRCNRAGSSELAKLNSRYRATYNTTEGELSITLATRRDQVDAINEQHLEELKGETMTFVGEISGDFPTNSLPTPESLELKIGAQVMFIKNDTEHRWVNGSLGTVSDIDDNGNISVILEDGDEHIVEPAVWENIKYSYNEKEKRIEEKVLGTYKQYPIRLAWAITVHKSQGLTFNHVVIDFTGGAFAGGQTYVALSRCTSLEGIILTRPITSRDIFVNAEVVKFSQTFNNPKLIERALQQAEADRSYHSAIKAFDNDDMEQFLDLFFKAIHLRYDIEKPVIRRYIRRKLGIIRQLKKENARLRHANDERNEAMRKYAYEYYLMGNECVVKAHDYRAALANFDKALTLDPTLVDAWVRKGVTLADTNEEIEAMACFNEALRLSPLNFKALYNRGKLRYENHEYEGAASDFAKAVAQKTQNAAAHERLGDTFMRLGLTDMAADHWAKAEDLRANKRKK